MHKWTFTGECITEGGEENSSDYSYSGERMALQLVMGKWVHNPHEVATGSTSEAFGDAWRQYAFRKQTNKHEILF
eukprot:scaffold31093_cov80-Attheya_sp.AAC.1